MGNGNTVQSGSLRSQIRLTILLTIWIELSRLPVAPAAADHVHGNANAPGALSNETTMMVTTVSHTLNPGRCDQLVEEVTTLKKKLNQMKTQVWRFEGSLNTMNLLELQEEEKQRLMEENIKLRNITKEKDQTIAWFRKQFMEKKKNLDLFAKIDEQDLEAVKTFVQMGADVNGTNNSSSRETPLHRAALLNDKDIALQIIIYLIENQADVFAKDGDDYTFLHRLVDDGTNLTPKQFHELSTYLVSRNLTRIFDTVGGPPKKYSAINISVTPFQLAVKNLEVESSTLSMLQRHGINLNAVDADGNSILFYGIMGNRSVRLLFELIALGADKEYRNSNHQNDSLLHIAAEYGTLEQIKLFLYLGLEINIVNDLGLTPLHKAVQSGKGNVLEKVALLLDKGADVKIKTNERKSALDFASQRDDLLEKDKIVKLLGEKD